MFGCEIPVWLSNILELSSRRIDYLHIARNISVAVDFAELVKGLVGNVGKVQLVVAYDNIRPKML